MFQGNPLLARQRIHMKNQDLFSSKGKSKKLKCYLLQFLFGALRVKFKNLYPTTPGWSVSEYASSSMV